jgi:hypothetical protein
MGGQPTMGVAPARSTGGGDSAIPGLGPLRRLMQALGGTVLPTSAAPAKDDPLPSEEDPAAFSDLLLPTTYQTKVDSIGGGPGVAAVSGERLGQSTQLAIVLTLCLQATGVQ